MRRFFLICQLLAAGAASLVVLAFTAPLLAALRVDRAERNRLAAMGHDRWLRECN